MDITHINHSAAQPLNALMTILLGVVVVLVYNLIQDLILWCRMIKLRGTYNEYKEEKGKEVLLDYSLVKIRVKLSVLAFFGAGVTLVLKQVGKEKKSQNWVCKTPLAMSNYLSPIGNYHYPGRNWGILNITINLKKKILYVKAVTKIHSEDKKIDSEYWLKKVVR